jgi:hypothetical protein
MLTQLQKNEPKQLKCLRRAQTRTLAVCVAGGPRRMKKASTISAAAEALGG